MVKKASRKKSKAKNRKPGKRASTSGTSAVGASTAAATGSAAGKGDATDVSAAAFQPGAFQPDVFQTGEVKPSASTAPTEARLEIGTPTLTEHPAGAVKLNAAVQSTGGEVSPPHELKAEGLTTAPPELGTSALWAGAGGVATNPFVLPSPVPITPTIYPDSPQGAIIVQNFITIDVRGVDYRNFEKHIGALVDELRKSNEIAGEVRDKLLADMTAGRAILSGPKPDRNLVQLLLVLPLKWIALVAVGGIIGDHASQALDALLKLLM